MSPPARSVAITLGVLMIAAGLALGLVTGGGWTIAGLGVVVIASVLVEGRYRGAKSGASDHARWQRTGERELDTETGEALEVWFDPATGARRYRPLGSERAG